MPLSDGCNHVTVITGDMDRFIAFYTGIFEATIRADLTEGPLRHALLDLGGGFCLHPFQLAEGNPHSAALPEIFARGHIDHFAVNFSDPHAFETVRGRLVAAGASEGRLADFGAVRLIEFTDPDGMTGEIAIRGDGPVLRHADRVLTPYHG